MIFRQWLAIHVLPSPATIDCSAHAVTIGVALRWACCEKSPAQFFTDERDPKCRTIVLKKQTCLIREAGCCSSTLALRNKGLR
jgi:hypothetical protein